MPFSLGFTADAAAAHRHEFSSQPESAPRSMFQIPQALGFAKPLKEAVIPSPSTLLPIITTSKTSTFDLSSSSGDDEDDRHSSTPKRPSQQQQQQQRQRARACSSRPKTLYQFAHPVASRRRLKLRPKLLLQLQESHAASRPFPKYDVLPADMTTKLACRLSKPLGGTARTFGSKDLVIVTSDMYEQIGTGDDRSISSDEASSEQREVVATICHCGSVDDGHRFAPKVEVALSSGVCWEGTPLANGSYELVTNGLGIAGSRKVRWVARDKKPISAPGRFTFSVIDPNSRRHPVIASMTRKGLTVFDQYSYPTATTTKTQARTDDEEDDDDETTPPGSPSPSRSTADTEMINTDEDLRQLIVITGTWVAFMEGWTTKSLTNGDASAGRIDSPLLSPRLRSSTYLSIDSGGDSTNAPDRPLSLCGSGGMSTPTTSRMNSFSRKKILNRRSTHSEVSRDRLSENDVGNENRRRSKSLTAADRLDSWIDVNGGQHQTGPKERGLLVESPRQDVDEANAEDEAKGKTKKWRRLSSMMFGRKKH